MALDPLVDRQNTSVNNDHSAKVVQAYIDSKKLIDVWRFKHPDVNGFTWRRHHPNIALSRLDYFFVDEHAIQFVDKIEVLPGFRTDHSIVKVSFDLASSKRGKSYWKIERWFA